MRHRSRVLLHGSPHLVHINGFPSELDSARQADLSSFYDLFRDLGLVAPAYVPLPSPFLEVILILMLTISLAD